MLSDKVEEPQSNAPIFGPVYQATKRAYSALAGLADTVRPALVHCGALLALFEFGHGKSHYAYRTLSETVGLSRLAGVRAAVRQDPAVNPDQEAGPEGDKGSVWWGLFILDQ